MTDAPKTILMEWNEYWRELKVKSNNGPLFFDDKSTKYLRADTVAAQLKAADELDEAITQEREMVCQDMELQAQVSRRLEVAITAYRKAKDEAQ